MAFPDPMYVLLKNQQYLTVVGALTQTFLDQTYFDGETYRDSLSAGHMGRQWVTGVPPAGTPESEDDNYTHTPPWPLEKTRTLIVWSNGANTVGQCFFDQYVGISSSVPRFVGG